MYKLFLSLLFLLYSGCLYAQNSVYQIEENLNEKLYQPLISYQGEQTALAFNPTQSEYCRDVTKGFTLNNPNDDSLGAISSSNNSYVLSQSVKLPDTWINRETIIYLAPQSLSFSLVVNGTEVCSIKEDIAFQFNISSLLKPTDNTIKLKLSGSSQKGMLNTIWLLSQPSLHIIDISISQLYVKDRFQKEIAWFENFEMKNYGAGIYDTTLHYTSKFYGQEGKLFKTFEGATSFKRLGEGEISRFGTFYKEGDFNTWNAEIPALYHFSLQLHTPDSQQVEVLSRKIGFHVIDFNEKVLSLGNIPVRTPIDLKPVYFQFPSLPNSANSKAILSRQLETLKQHNVNTLVVPLLPTNSLLYELCDALGLYVIHMVDASDFSDLITPFPLPEDPIWTQRARLMGAIHQIKTHPSTLAVFVNASYDSIAYAKRLAETVYEADISTMVAFEDRIIYEKQTIAQSLPIDWLHTHQWDELDPLEGRAQLKYRYQPVDFLMSESFSDKLILVNGYDFLELDHLELYWQVTQQGNVLKQGIIDSLSAQPKMRQEILLPFELGEYKNAEDVVFNFWVSLKESTPWAPKGHCIASQQFTFVTTEQKRTLTKLDPTRKD